MATFCFLSWEESHRKRQERERRSARPRRREQYGDSKRGAATKGQRRYANIGHMEPDAYMSVRHNIHKFKHNINEKFARMLPSQVEGSKKTVQSSTSCGGCRQWRPGGPEHSDPRFAWQDDVNATVINALQMSSFCHLLVAGPSCFTEPSVFRIVDRQGRTEFLENHEGQYSRAATEQHKTSNQVEMAMEPKQIAV